MVQIEETLTPRKFELIRDQIATILAAELPNQATLNTDPEINATVWLERLVPLSQQECPAVNVFAADGKFERFTTESQTGEYMFAIDVFTRGATEGSAAEQRGDLISTKKMMRIVGIIQAIFSHYRYCKLGFSNNFIDRVQINEFKLMEPVKAHDHSNVSKGRLILMVKAEETLEPVTPILIAGYDTAVKLCTTDYGYMFSGDQPDIPPPVPDPGDVFNTLDEQLGVVPSGGVFVVGDSNVSNSDNSYSVDLPATNDLELPDIIHINSDGTSVILPAQKSMICTPAAATSIGKRLMKTNQLVSYQTGDDGDQQNGRDVSFFELDGNNPFGHPYRFVGATGGYTNGSSYFDVNGVATTRSLAFPNDIALDFSTNAKSLVLGYYFGDTTTARIWGDCIAWGVGLSVSTYVTGWRVANAYEMMNVNNFNSIWALNYPPFVRTGSQSFWTSSTNRLTTSQALALVNNSNSVLSAAKTIALGAYATRDFSHTELGI